MKYLLLTKHITPGGDRSNWEVFDNVDDAKQRLSILEKQSRQYDGLPLIAPIMVQFILIKVEEVL